MNLKKFFTLLVLLLSCGFIQNAIGQNTSTIQFANPNITCNGGTPTQFCIDVTLQSAGAAYNNEGWATFVNYDPAVLSSPQVTVNPLFSVTDYATAVNISTPGVINASCEHLTAVFVAIPSTPLVAYTACFTVVAPGDPGLSFNNSLGFTLIYDQDFNEVPLSPTPAAFNTPVACQVDPCAGVNIDVQAGYNCVDGVATLAIENPSFDLTYSINGNEVVDGDPLQDGVTYFLIATNADGCAGSSSAIVVDCPAVIDPCEGIVAITASASYDCNGGGVALTISGGTGDYTTNFSDGDVLDNGNYTLTVSDNGVCDVADATANFTVDCQIIDPCEGVVAITASASYDCNGGGVALSISGGTGDYTANFSDGDVLDNGNYTLTVSDNGVCDVADATANFTVECVVTPTVVPLVINEIDYDQPGDDTGEFIEIYNPTGEDALLDGFYIELVSGVDGSLYNTIQLTGSIAAGDYYVVCAEGSTASNCDLFVPTGAAGFLQNGPDAIGLFLDNGDGTSATLDLVSYEATVAGYSEGNDAGNDNNTDDNKSLSRIPNGSDTDDNAADFALVGSTPGVANDACAGTTWTVSASASCDETTGTASLVLVAENGITYTLNGNTATNGQALSNGTYTVVGVDENGCTKQSNPFTVACGVVDPCEGVSISINADYNCTDGVATLVIDNPDFQFDYTYSDGGTAATGDVLTNGVSYTIVATNADGCIGSDNIGVVNCPGVDPCAGVTITVDAAYGCDNGVAALILNNQDGVSYTYGDGSTATNGDLLMDDVTYTITGTNANGCSGSTDVAVDCNPIVDPCAGVTINVTAAYSCVTGLTVSATGGTAPYTFTIAGNTVGNGTILANDTYTIVAEDANGCTSTQDVTANCTGCTNPPVVALVPPTTSVCNSVSEGNTSFNLNTILGTSTPGGIWSGTNVSGSNFSGAGLAPGGYTVTYAIAAAGECPAVSGTRTIFVTDCNLPPVAVADFIAVEPGTTLVTVNVINNDSDAGGTVILTGATVAPGNGSVSTSGGNVIYTPSAGATGTVIITYTIVDNVGQTATGTLTVLFSGCLANAGTIDLVSNFVNEDDKFVYCDDATIFVLQSSPYNDDNGYTQVYVVADTLGNIAAIHSGSPIPAPAPGIWSVCAVNYEDGNITGLTVGANTNDLGGCYSISCADRFLILNPIVITYTIEYDGPDQIVHFQITGGYPSNSGFGGYSVNWPPFTAVYDPILGYAPFDLVFPCSAEGPFNFAVYSDGALCDEFVTVTLAPNCPVCNPMPGAMTGSQTLCAGEVASVISNGLEIHAEDNEVAAYVLYNPNTPNDILQTVIVTSAGQSATFAFDAATMTYGTVYEVTAYVGPDEDSNNLPDWDNLECTAASSPTQLTFLAPIVLTAPFVCNDIDQTYTVVLGVTGRPEGTTYQVTGTGVNATFTGNTSIWGPYQGGTAYEFQVSDEFGCQSNIVSEDTASCKITPIQLLSFTGEVLANGNLLKWSTATEYNNDYFTLYRSTDGINFTPVATIDGAGNSTAVLNYNFLDKNAPAGLSYYRLVQTDFDGQKSAPVDITLTRGEIKFGITQLMPIPTNANLEVNFASATKNVVTMTIHNIEGKLVSTQAVEANIGFNVVKLDVSAYASGVYFITLNNGNEVTTGRFVKQQ